MSGAWIQGHPWIAIAAALLAFAFLFGIAGFYARRGSNPELTRKLVHASSGLLTLAFPFVFRDVWPVVLLTGASAVAIGAAKFAQPVRARFGHVASGVERTTLGELYFPIAVALLFWLTRGEHALLFVIPVLVLTLADATGALVGGRYGTVRYAGASKSLEGSIAFAVVAFFCIHVPLLLWGPAGRVETLLISATLALLVMLLEGSAWRGLDNLFIPLGGYFLLRAYLTLDATGLTTRLAVTVALVTLIVFSRQRTTLEDDSLVAGAFLCYVAWAVAGWRWLVAPVMIFIGYAWISARTPDNSRRMHDVPAVLSVWTPALVWVVMARANDDSALLYAYSVVFAAHLAMFGVSRVAYQFPERPVTPLFWRAILTAWAIVLVPFVITAGATPTLAAAAVLALVAIALGSAAFVSSQPNVRRMPQDAQRWLWQATAAGGASLAAWLLLVGLRRAVTWTTG